MLCPVAPLSVRAGRSLTSAIRDAFDRDEAGFESPLPSPSTSPAPLTPSSPLTPLSDSDSMDVPVIFLPPLSTSAEAHPLTTERAETLPANAFNSLPGSDAESDQCYPPSDPGGTGMSADATSNGTSGRTSDVSDSASAPTNDGKRKRSKGDKSAKKRKRQHKRQAIAEDRQPTSLHGSTFQEAPAILRTDLTSDEAMAACSTGFTALRASALKSGKVWTLPQVLEEGHKLLAWDGR